MNKNGRVLKTLVDDTIRKLNITDARLRSNLTHMYKLERGVKAKPAKINENVGNTVNAMKSDSISWNVAYAFFKSLRFPKITLSITYHGLAGRDVEVRRTINFLHGEKSK